MNELDRIMTAAQKAGFLDGKDIVLPRILVEFLNHYDELEHKADPEAWREENRKKQAAGVRYEKFIQGMWWLVGRHCKFTGKKEDYREVPQEPHAAERALWKAQREAGTNEVWQQTNKFGSICDVPVSYEPTWNPDCAYRVKPMKLTARILRRQQIRPNKVNEIQTWEFYGTREEYHAECEKYGYVVVSEITEVKPKTANFYVATVRRAVKFYSSEIDFTSHLNAQGLIIIGNIEEREVEI